MKRHGCLVLILAGLSRPGALPAELSETNRPPAPENWNWHTQNTDIVQGDPGFPAQYTGPHSLHSAGEVRETVSLDLLGGLRLWEGAEAHLDGLLWQGFGLSKTSGLEAFPSGEAFRLGSTTPNVTCARIFLRQDIALSGETESIEDDPLHLAGQQATSRVTVTIGKFSAKDIFDNNAFANDPRTQFMNWALMANEAWDYPADSLGFETGLAVEWYLPHWAMRYGFFQMPRISNGMAQDSHYLEAWGMVAEFERRYHLGSRPGTIRFLAFLNRADMGSYDQALANAERPANIEATRVYRHKYGFGLNWEQELAHDLGVFSRLGWSDGRNEAWTFADVDRTATLGFSLKGGRWQRPGDTVGLAGVLNAISREHHEFLAAGGLGILAGDGRLNYGFEKAFELYYDFQVWKTLHATLDYQFVTNPAYNRDRGPVSILGARAHWQF